MVLAAIVIELALISSRTASSWVGVWPNATVTAQFPIYVLGPLWAAYIALSRSEARADRFIATYSTRPGFLAHLRVIGLTWIAALIPYAAGIAYVTARSLTNPGQGFIWWSYIAFGATVYLGCCTVGYLIGSIFSGLYSAAIALFITYLYIATPWSMRRSELALISGYPSYDLNGHKALLLGAHTLALLVLTAMICAARELVDGRWQTRRRVRLLTAGSALILLAFIPSLGSAGGLQVPRTPVDPVCSPDDPQVCVWPENSAKLPTLAAKVAKLEEVTAFGFTMPERFTEDSLAAEDPDSPDPRTATFEVAGDALEFVTDDWALEMVSREVTFCDESSDEDYTASSVPVAELAEWVGYRINDGKPSPLHGSFPGVDPEQIRAIVVNDSDAEQQRWGDERLEILHDISAKCR